MASDEDEEEVYLLVELSGLASADTIKSCQGTCAIIGIDSEEPLLQLDSYVFKGHYEDILGTAMLFQQDKGRKLKYVCKMGKKLTMQRVFLKKKAEGKHAIFAAPWVPTGGCKGAPLGPDTSANLNAGDKEQGSTPITTSISSDGSQVPIPMIVSVEGKVPFP